MAPGIDGDHRPRHLGLEGGLQREFVMVRVHRGRDHPGVIHQLQRQEGTTSFVWFGATSSVVLKLPWSGAATATV